MREIEFIQILQSPSLKPVGNVRVAETPLMMEVDRQESLAMKSPRQGSGQSEFVWSTTALPRAQRKQAAEALRNFQLSLSNPSKPGQAETSESFPVYFGTVGKHGVVGNAG